MTKKMMTADQLIYLVHQELSARDVIAKSHPSCAIVPDGDSWSILMSPRDRRRFPEEAKVINQMQTRLRRTYQLAN